MPDVFDQTQGRPRTSAQTQPATDPFAATQIARRPAAAVAAPAPVEEDWRAGGGLWAALNRADRLGGRAIERIAGGAARVGGNVADAVGLDGVGDWFQNEARASERRAAAPVAGTTSWADVKANPSVGTVVPFAFEQGLGSAPDMAAVMMAPWLYGVTRAGTIGQERAINNGRTDSNIFDTIKSLPAAAASTILERGATRVILAAPKKGVGGVLLGGGIEGGQEFLQSGAEYAGGTVGTQRGFDAAEALDQSLAGAVAGAPFGSAVNATSQGVSKLRSAYAARGVNTDSIDDASLVSGSLDGSLGETLGIDPAEVLRGAGLNPDSFTDPAAMAARVAAAQGRVPTNDLGPVELQRQRGILEAIADGNTDPSFAPVLPPRTMPDGVPIIAAPEGNIRGDDQGGMVGLERKRAADDNVLDAARDAAARDPLIATILDANVPADVKIRTLWERLDEFRAARDEDAGVPPAPDQVAAPSLPAGQPANPYRRSTVEAARGAPRQTQAGRATDEQWAAIIGIEGGTDAKGRFRTSPAGAIGPAQVMPGTAPEAARLAGLPWDEKKYRTDAAYNQALGRAYYDQQLRTFGGDAAKAAAAYNAGPGSARTGRGVRGAMAKAEAAGNPDNWQAYLPEETRNYVDNFRRRTGAPGAAPGGTAADAAAPYRMSAPDEAAIDGRFSAAERPNSGDTLGGDAENIGARTSPTLGELERGTMNGTSTPTQGGPMATGGETRAYKDVTDDPEGQPGFWEQRSRAQAEEAFTKRQADLDEEWARRAEAEAERARRGGKTKFEEERTSTGADPRETYGKYGQRPVKDGEFWRTNDEGFIVDKDGNPVAFGKHKLAAVWARANKMGGDFDPVSWGANSTRMTLQRRKTSTYGQAAAPDAPADNPFDGTQRALPGPVSAQDAAPAPAPSATVEPGPAPAAAPAGLDATLDALDDELEAMRGDKDAEGTPLHDALKVATGGTGVTSWSRGPDGVKVYKGVTGIEAAREAGRDDVANAIVERARRDVERTEAASAAKPNNTMLAKSAADAKDALAAMEAAAGQGRRQAAPAPAPSRAPVTGASETVRTARGREVETEFEVREAGDLISSDMPGYRADLQPRDRANRSSSDAQVAEIAAGLDPEQLGSSRLASQGAPIIGSDGMVESGNGRTAAIRRMYRQFPERAAAYRAMIEGRGLSTEGFTNPVLVRRRKAEMNDEDRLAFVREANERDTQAMSSTEQANIDAKAMTETTLGMYRGGAITDAANRDFIRRFMDEVVTPADRNTMMQADGQLSVDGVRRIRTAMLAKAFGDADLVAKIVEDPDTNIRAIGNVLTDLAPLLASLRLSAPDYDISKQVAEMAKLISRARAEGTTAFDLVAQNDIFAGETDPTTEALVRLMFKADGKPRSAAAMSDGLRFYVQEAGKVDTSPGMFGDAAPAASPVDILTLARERQEAKEARNSGADNGDMFGGGGSVPPSGGGTAGAASGGRKGKLKGSTVLNTLGSILGDEKGSFNPAAFSGLLGKIIDGEGISRDVARLRAAIGSPTATLKAMGGPMKRLISAAMFTNDARIRGLAERFDSQALRDYADLWHARSGKDDATGRTYHEAVARAATTRTQRMFETLQPFLANEASLARIKELLTNPNKTTRATVEERAAAKDLRELLKETITYRKKAGEDVGEVTDGYFPRVLSVERVIAKKDDFLKRAEKLYRGQGVADPKAAAEAWFSRVFDEYAGLDGGFGIGGSGGGAGTASAKAREFGKAADTEMREFYEPDVFNTLASYFTGSAKRAEYARRFGKAGETGSDKRKAWEEEHGDKSRFQVLEDRIKEDVRESGLPADGVLRILENVHKSNLGQMGTNDPFARTATSYLHTWNQLAKMDRVTITSLGELTMGFIRGGPRYGFTFLKDSVSEFVRQVRGAAPTDAYRWAEAIGVANDAMVNQSLTSREATSDNMTLGSQKVLAGFYKAIGLHQFTEGTRTAAVKMGRNFIDNLAHDLESPRARVRNRADLYLKELGVKDPAAFGKRIREGGFTRDDVLADQGPASEYGTALLRFVNQTIMMPSRAEKPTWASHPVGGLIFSLMGYSYGFKKNVLDRGARLAVRGVKTKDPALLIPAMSLMIMAAFQGANDTLLRPFLFGSNYNFAEETPGEFFLRVVDRAGFTGGLSPIVNAIKAVRYDRSLLESLSGPVVGSLGNAAQKIAIEPFTSRNSPNTQTAERNAATAIYDAVLDPVIDGFAAARLKGIVRTGAILGTGNREGGIAPGDKDAFVTAVAGEKEDDK